jgi:outer membrane phospholipase A
MKKDNNSNIHEIAFQISKKLVDMILGLEIAFDQFLSDFHLNEHVYSLPLQRTIWKPTLFLKLKPNVI